jgi:hypothetical protein
MEHSGKARRLRLRVEPESSIAALYLRAPHAIALLVLAHGAGAGMSHPFMVAMADLLAEAGVSTLRFQFPYTEAGSKRPDPPAVAHATIRAAVRKAAKLAPALPLFAGGKSFGGRMTSQAQALEPLPNVRGLVFLGFPLHPPDKAVHRPGGTSRRDPHPPVVHPGNARRARAACAPAKGHEGPGEAGHLPADRRRRPFVRCPRSVGPKPSGGAPQDCRGHGRMDERSGIDEAAC